MSAGNAIATSLVARLRQAFAGHAMRGVIVGIALLLAGMQLALQTHLIQHDLLPANHQVCEQCVVAKSAPPPPSMVALVPPSAGAVVLVVAAPRAPLARAPLAERNRGPPAAA